MESHSNQSNHEYELIQMVENNDTVDDVEDEREPIANNQESGKYFIWGMYDQNKHFVIVIPDFANVILTTVDVFSDIYQFFVYLT